MILHAGACPGGGAQDPLEIEKQKKMSSEQILRYFTYIFSAIFWAASPPPMRNWKAKKNTCAYIAMQVQFVEIWNKLWPNLAQ